jgi:Flp pilus assembly protein TadB
MLAGIVVAGGLALVVWWLVPAQPELGDVLDRFAPDKAARLRRAAMGEERVADSDRLGMWLLRHFPSVGWARSLRQELAVVGRPVHTHYGVKLLRAGQMLVGVPLGCSVFVVAAGLDWQVPVVGALVAAVGGWISPDAQVRSLAARRRLEFRYALASYVDLVAVDRMAGASGARQALENAARVSRNWVFVQLQQLYTRTQLERVAPWDGLAELAARYGIPELDDLATQMRVADESGVSVYESLQALSAASRDALLAAEKTRAKGAQAQMVFPLFLMAVPIIALVVGPMLLMLAGAGVPW